MCVPCYIGGGMAVADHKQHAPARVRVFVVTVSDTRTEATDTSGRAARELIEAAGHVVAGYRLLKDEPAEVAALIRADRRGAQRRRRGHLGRHRHHRARLDLRGGRRRCSTSGSTASASCSACSRTTRSAPAAMMSRAVAGLHRGVVVFATPGSTAAVKLALDKLIIPELGHLVFEAHR